MPELTRESHFYDNSMLSAYKECPRRYFLRHELGWRSEGTALPLAFGLAWHSGMDVVWEYARSTEHKELARAALAKFLDTWEEQGLPADLDVELQDRYAPRTPSTANEMFEHYIEARWPVLREMQLIASEQPFAVPLPGSSVWYVGRLDKVIGYNGQKLVIEHKSTTAYKKDGGFTTDYVEGWFSDSQVKGYQFGGSLFFDGLDAVWVDAALVHRAVHDAFRFIPVAHGKVLLEEWLNDTLEWVRRVELDTKNYKLTGRLEAGAFPKNESSCFAKFGRCQFLDICRTVADPTVFSEPPPGYTEDRWAPFELLNLQKLIEKETVSG